MSKKIITNWTINEEKFQALYELHLVRLRELNIHRLIDDPIPDTLVDSMKKLSESVVENINAKKIRINEFYILKKECLNGILKSGANEVTFHLIQIEDISILKQENIIDIKNGDFQMAVSFDNSQIIYLVFGVSKPTEITKDNLKDFKSSFAKNILPEMNKDIKMRTNSLKEKNTTEIYVPIEDFSKFKDELIIHVALSDINFQHLFHSITHLYNFTIILSDTDFKDPARLATAVNQDVYRTCQPYCSGTGGGLI